MVAPNCRREPLIVARISAYPCELLKVNPAVVNDSASWRNIVRVTDSKRNSRRIQLQNLQCPMNLDFSLNLMKYLASEENFRFRPIRAELGYKDRMLFHHIGYLYEIL